MLLLENLAAQLECFKVLRDVIDIDCGGLLLQKLDTLDPYLIKFLNFMIFLTILVLIIIGTLYLDAKDTIFLIWLVLLGQNYVRQALRLGPHKSYE